MFYHMWVGFPFHHHRQNAEQPTAARPPGTGWQPRPCCPPSTASPQGPRPVSSSDLASLKKGVQMALHRVKPWGLALPSAWSPGHSSAGVFQYCLSRIEDCSMGRLYCHSFHRIPTEGQPSRFRFGARTKWERGYLHASIWVNGSLFPWDHCWLGWWQSCTGIACLALKPFFFKLQKLSSGEATPFYVPSMQWMCDSQSHPHWRGHCVFFLNVSSHWQPDGPALPSKSVLVPRGGLVRTHALAVQRVAPAPAGRIRHRRCLPAIPAHTE